MVGSATARTAAVAAGGAAPRRVGVAASGGRDSTALLHCTVRAARSAGVDVVALHVHHGWMAEADVWQARVRDQSRRWGAGFAARRLTTRPAQGDSVEAWARRERYRALSDMARDAGCSVVLLAHHRADQAETFLLQALRGGFVSGLAAMPRVAVRNDIVFARPWLDLPRRAIEHYVARHRLRHVDDASNVDPRYARSRLRSNVMPALTHAFADAEATLALAARNAAQASALAAEVAAVDVPPLVDAAGSLLVERWSALPPARRRNAMAAWLAATAPGAATHALVERLLAELPGRHAARWPAGGAELRLYRGRLTAAAAAAVAPFDSARGGTALASPLPDLDREGDYAIAGWAGRLQVRAATAHGAPPVALRGLRAAARTGSERFCLAASGAPRSLKKQFQARGVAAWQRGGPLLFAGDGSLVFASGLGVDGRWQAAPHAPQFALRWVADEPR